MDLFVSMMITQKQTNMPHIRDMPPKDAHKMANSADPDHTGQYNQGLHCLLGLICSKKTY